MYWFWPNFLYSLWWRNLSWCLFFLKAVFCWKKKMIFFQNPEISEHSTLFTTVNFSNELLGFYDWLQFLYFLIKAQLVLDNIEYEKNGKNFSDCCFSLWKFWKENANNNNRNFFPQNLKIFLPFKPSYLFNQKTLEESFFELTYPQSFVAKT